MPKQYALEKLRERKFVVSQVKLEYGDEWEAVLGSPQLEATTNKRMTLIFKDDKLVYARRQLGTLVYPSAVRLFSQMCQNIRWATAGRDVRKPSVLAFDDSNSMSADDEERRSCTIHLESGGPQYSINVQEPIGGSKAVSYVSVSEVIESPNTSDLEPRKNTRE
jgi:hypothetical protein